MEDKKQKEEVQKSEISLKEESILKFWKDNNIFEKSLDKESPRGKYVFYDGPPFATGLPHYGHILGSVAKDVIGRYQTMSGFCVPRRWGWDCHGLPIENIVEKDLGISGKKAIEALGIDNFTEHARSKVLTYVGEWKKTVDRIGRWVDFDNSYKTMDNTFIESVWWALSELEKKGLLYEGVRVLAYCPRCETPIANSEIAMDNSYKDITDISVYVKFKILDESFKNTFLLAWTTTPWTLPGNTAIAINKDLVYIFVKNKTENGEEIFIIAKDLFENLKAKFNEPEIVKEVEGSALLGLSYEPVFDYYKNTDMHNKENIWKVWHADFVTVDKGTGIAHEAPAFGEDDMDLAKKNDIPFIRHVEPNGDFSCEVIDFPNTKVKPKEDHQATDVMVIKYLAHRGLLFAKEKIIHSYPHCYRCETPLLYYALPSWFINIQKVKKDLLEKAEDINWIPSHFKEGRFRNIMEGAPDWTISRNRYWASPLPIWKSEKGEIMFVNSIEDLKVKTKKSGNKYFVMRHGGAESNLTGTISSKVEDVDHLTEEGRKQVLDSAQELKNKKIDLIIFSDFMRTKETAEIVKNELNILDENFIPDTRLRELCAGDFNGKKWSEYPHFLKAAPAGSESFTDVKKRVGSAMYEIERKYQNKNILFVTHDSPARLMFYTSLGLNMDEVTKIGASLNRFKNAEVRELSFVPLPCNKNYEIDLHRPYIDAVILVDKDGKEYKRIPEVVDCWFESGSMPFAQDHFPFENKDWRKENFPAGFVAEYVAQTRTWFYYTHAISTMLFGDAPFKNVVTTGTVLAEDGSKMSKSKNNYPDPWIIFNKYGVDALRFYLMSSTLMKGEDVNFSEKTVQEVSSKIIGRLNNVVAFYELYREKDLELSDSAIESANILDTWIMTKLNKLTEEVTLGMSEYNMAKATRPFDLFIEDLSIWYLRRSRERMKEGDKDAKQTLYFVLKTLIKMMAPFTPFTSEDIWQRLKREVDAQSIHLVNWPTSSESFTHKIFSRFNLKENSTIEKMEETRKIVTLGLQARQKNAIAVRQPLAKLEVKNLTLDAEYLELIKDELNIKEIIENKNIDTEVFLDTNITLELREEGNYRELVRAMQEMRKSMGLTPSDVVTFSIEVKDDGRKLIQKFESEIKKIVLAKDIKFENNNGDLVKIDQLDFKISIQK